MKISSRRVSFDGTVCGISPEQNDIFSAVDGSLIITSFWPEVAARRVRMEGYWVCGAMEAQQGIVLLVSRQAGGPPDDCGPLPKGHDGLIAETGRDPSLPEPGISESDTRKNVLIILDRRDLQVVARMEAPSSGWLFPCLYPSELPNLTLIVGKVPWESSKKEVWATLSLCRVNSATLLEEWQAEVKHVVDFSIDTIGNSCHVLTEQSSQVISLATGNIVRSDKLPTGRGIKSWARICAAAPACFLAGVSRDQSEIVLCQWSPDSGTTKVVYRAAIESLIPEAPVLSAGDIKSLHYRPGIGQVLWLPAVSRLVFELYVPAELGSGGDMLLKGLFAVNPVSGDCFTCHAEDGCGTGSLLRVADDRILYNELLMTFKE